MGNQGANHDSVHLEELEHAARSILCRAHHALTYVWVLYSESETQHMGYDGSVDERGSANEDMVGPQRHV